jgi:chromosome segregation ATPase
MAIPGKNKSILIYLREHIQSWMSINSGTPSPRQSILNQVSDKTILQQHLKDTTQLDIVKRASNGQGLSFFDIMNKQCDGLESRLAAEESMLRNDNTNLQDQIVNLQDQIANLKNKLDVQTKNLRNKATCLRDEITTLWNETNLQNEMTNKTRSLQNEIRNEITSLQNEITNLRNEAISLQKQISSQQDQMTITHSSELLQYLPFETSTCGPIRRRMSPT